MLLLTEITGTDPERKMQITDMMVTHTVRSTPGTASRAEHTIRMYRPNKDAGPLGGTLLVTLVLTAEQAAELKAHL